MQNSWSLSDKFGTVGADQINCGTVGADQISCGKVGADQICCGTVGADQISCGTVGADQISCRTVGADQISCGKVIAYQALKNNRIAFRAELCQHRASSFDFGLFKQLICIKKYIEIIVSKFSNSFSTNILRKYQSGRQSDLS